MAADAKPMTKTEVYQALADQTGLSRKQVAAVFDSLGELIRKNLGRSGPGVFTLAGLVKIEKRKVPARPAQKGVLNRFTGQLTDVAAKPASTKVRVRALKNLKGMV